MKALFLGHFAAGVAPRILAKVKTPLESSTLDDEGDAAQLAPLLAEAEIVVGHIWRAERHNRGDHLSWRREHMKALFLGHLAADVAPRTVAKVTTPQEVSSLHEDCVSSAH